MSAPTRDQLLARAEAWVANDPDPDTRSAAVALVARAQAAVDRAPGDPERTSADAELARHFGPRVEFGTAGLRAALGPGPGAMNALVVRQAAAGVAAVLAPGDRERGVVVGHDARHGSELFARHAAGVLQAAGIPTWLTAGARPTPLVAYALRHLRAAAALVVTASHNPAVDNGLKVYWGDGAQIAPPLDREIAAAIAAVAGEHDAGNPPGEPVERISTRLLAPSVEENYLASVGALALGSGQAISPLRIVCTSLHGVGNELLQAALFRAGFVNVASVSEQAAPDPDFPTVGFPNPEEPGALDLLLALARAEDADVALANDPDADRLAVAVPTPAGEWRVLSGDELGLLLADAALARWEAAGAQRLLVTSVVSSGALGELAQARGVEFAETLTGFKWLSRPAIDRPELTQCLAYEEALGYSIGPDSRDKDGIAAAVLLCSALSAWRRSGDDALTKLAALASEVGERATDNRSVRLAPGVSGAAVAARLVGDPPVAEALGATVVRTDRPAPDVLRWWFTNGARVVVRPSGTEAKVKLYVEVTRQGPVHPSANVDRNPGEPAEPAMAPSASEATGPDEVARGVADLVEAWIRGAAHDVVATATGTAD